MARAKNAATVAQRWVDRMTGADANIKSGVQSVTVAPTQLAAAAKDKWIAGVQAAAANGKYEKGLQNVTLGDWQKAMVDKGIPNMRTGVQAAKQKMTNFLSNFLPFAAQVSDQIRSMPNTTKEDRRARMNANFDMMSQYSNNG